MKVFGHLATPSLSQLKIKITPPSDKIKNIYIGVLLTYQFVEYNGYTGLKTV